MRVRSRPHMPERGARAGGPRRAARAPAAADFPARPGPATPGTGTEFETLGAGAGADRVAAQRAGAGGEAVGELAAAAANLGHVQCLRGRGAAARVRFEQALAADPQCAPALLGLAAVRCV